MRKKHNESSPFSYFLLVELLGYAFSVCVCVCAQVFFFFSVPCGRRGVNDTKLLIYLYFSLFFFGGGSGGGWVGVEARCQGKRQKYQLVYMHV